MCEACLAYFLLYSLNSCAVPHEVSHINSVKNCIFMSSANSCVKVLTPSGMV